MELLKKNTCLKNYGKPIFIYDIETCGNGGKEAKEMVINRSYDIWSLNGCSSCLNAVSYEWCNQVAA